MAYTIRDVSRLAGVSTATVSRTFTAPDRVSPKARQSVVEAARILNYQPNAIARSMARQQTERVAFLICKQGSGILDEFYAGICEGIMHEINASDYQLLISTAEEWEVVKQKQVDGVILGGQATPALVSDFQAQKIPIVLVNNEVQGTKIPCVLNDEEAGVRMAVRHLAERGHTKIGMIVGRLSPYIYGKRYDAFLKVMKELELPIRNGYIRSADPAVGTAAETAMDLLTMEDPPTAVLGANDVLATGVIKAAIRLGKRIPEDVAVIGFDDSSVCGALEPEMTSIHICKHEMGIRSARLLLELLKGTETGEDLQVVPPRIVVRDST